MPWANSIQGETADLDRSGVAFQPARELPSLLRESTNIAQASEVQAIVPKGVQEHQFSAGEIFAGYLENGIDQFDRLTETLTDSGATPVKISFPMHGGRIGFATFSAVKLLSEDRSSWQWQGTVDGISYSSVVLTKWKGVVFGSVYAAEAGDFEWRQKDSGKIAVYRFDPTNLPDCDDDGVANQPVPDLDPQSDVAFERTSLAANLINTRNYVDVVVGYNDQARIALGGSPGKPGDNAHIEAKILTALADANISYRDSEIDLEMRISWMGPIEYPYPSGEDFTRALDEISNENDGKGDELSRMKAKYQADFACLWVDSSSTGGLATVIISELQSHLAYSIVRAKNPTATFVHEIGHNMGCRHLRDGYTSTPSSWHPYAFAHKFAGSDGKTYVTVMASTGDETRTQADARLLRFSNPRITYRNRLTGVANLADCARNIQEIRQILQDFRPSPPLESSISNVATGAQITLSKGFVARRYAVWRSLDLVNWTKIGINTTGSNGAVSRNVEGADTFPQVFYRWSAEP